MIIRHDFSAHAGFSRPVGDKPESPEQDNTARSIPRGLAIGFPGDALPPARQSRRLWRRMSAAGFLELSCGAFCAFAPSTVLSPLIAGAHDALDIARHLARLGYGGEYRIVAPNLPDYALVRREIRAEAPGLDCRVTGAEGLARLLGTGF